MTSARTRERLVNRLIEQGISNQRVLEVMSTTPRHLFVEEAFASRAYDDCSLPIGHGQTISQPYIVAKMSEVLLSDGPRDRVLEIGTGSGYQTAILAQLVRQVFSVERVLPLVERAEKVLLSLQYKNIALFGADGHWGVAEEAPFDGIIVTAAPRGVPTPLVEQLAVGGRMVIPAGDENSQKLLVVKKTDRGVTQEAIDNVKFVPMHTGKPR